ncbi:MAG: hypothetical protein NVS2B4_08110 [Ramlibacter sp.]
MLWSAGPGCWPSAHNATERGITRKRLGAIGGRVAFLAALSGLLAGCAGAAITGATDVDKASFGEKKRFAVVTIASNKEFSGERALFDTFRSADNVAGANSQPIIDKLASRIVGTLAGRPSSCLCRKAGSWATARTGLHKRTPEW